MSKTYNVSKCVHCKCHTYTDDLEDGVCPDCWANSELHSELEQPEAITHDIMDEIRDINTEIESKISQERYYETRQYYSIMDEIEKCYD